MNLCSRREDIFVSVCFPDVTPGDEDCRAELSRLSRILTARYRYCELLLVVVADGRQDHETFLNSVSNVRLLLVRPGTPFYRRRAAIASEAIGDIVVLASIDEKLDLVEMIELAALKGCGVIAQRSERSLMNPILRILGSSAGFRVDTRDMLTAAYPRLLLNKLLVHPDRQLALRFAPYDNGIPVIRLRSAEKHTRSFREFGRRLGVVQNLLVSSAPRVLTLLSILSLIVVFVAFSYGIYAVIVWSTLATIQPGWFTTSLVLSLTAAFLGGAVFGLSIGLQKMIEALSSDAVDDIIDERSTVDMFDEAKMELNVEIGALAGDGRVRGRGHEF